jgi:hypothetical protein
MIQKSLGQYRLAFYIIGLYLILDGIGSIVIYQKQPWFPDHTLRIIRMLVGGIVIGFGEKVCQ